MGVLFRNYVLYLSNLYQGIQCSLFKDVQFYTTNYSFVALDTKMPNERIKPLKKFPINKETGVLDKNPIQQ